MFSNPTYSDIGGDRVIRGATLSRPLLFLLRASCGDDRRAAAKYNNLSFSPSRPIGPFNVRISLMLHSAILHCRRKVFQDGFVKLPALCPGNKAAEYLPTSLWNCREDLFQNLAIGKMSKRCNTAAGLTDSPAPRCDRHQ